MGGKHEEENLIFKNQTFILDLKAGVLLLLEWSYGIDLKIN